MNSRFENPQTFVRSIKGAPSSILWALLFVRRPMTNQELQRWTGFGDDNITNGVKLLAELGWVVAISPRGPWALADQARQLPLVNFFDNDESDLIGIGATTTTNRIEPGVIVKPGSSSKKTNPKKSESPTNPHFEANLKACRAGGIGEPMASRISNLFSDLDEPIRPEEIEAHCRDTGRQDIGLAITRLLGGEFPPSWVDSIPDAVEKLRDKEKELALIQYEINQAYEEADESDESDESEEDF